MIIDHQEEPIGLELEVLEQKYYSNVLINQPRLIFGQPESLVSPFYLENSYI